jgi:pyruvate dehydrogenase (quinone)
VERPGDIGSAWDAALASDRPAVLEFVTDPAIPPIPPHATLEQMENMASAMVRGDSDRWAVLREGIKEKVQEFLPGRSGGHS